MCSESNIDAGSQLPTAVQLHILSLLPLNERALSGRLVSPEARDDLTGPQHCTASLSQPLPHHAMPWAVAAGQEYVRQLPLWLKRCLMCTAAASGCEFNLEVALAALQPSFFSKILQHPVFNWNYNDVGVAAVKAGHPQLLGWLLRHCPGLLQPDRVLEAAARHCDLAGLQAAWAALQGVSDWANGARPLLGQGVLDAAAGSATPDAVAKMQWVLEAGGGSCSLATSTAAAAASSGDLDALQWLWEHGCPLTNGGQFDHARTLGSASLAVAQWLVDEVGCELPAAWQGAAQSAHAGRVWEFLLLRTAQGPDAAAKLRWLQERGAPPLDGEGGMRSELLFRLAVSAAKAGNVDLLRPLLLALGPERVAGHPIWDQAAKSGSIPVMECLREAGVRFTTKAYWRAAENGHLGIVRWLARVVWGARADGLILNSFVAMWPAGTLARSRDLLEAVQLLVGEAVCTVCLVEYGALCVLGMRGSSALAQCVLGQKPGHRPGTKAVEAAVLAGNEALLEWMVQQVDRVESLDGDKLYPLAAKNGDRGTLAALRRLGVPWGAEDLVVQAVWEGSCMAAVRWLVEQGAPVGSREGMEKAIEGREQRQKLGDEEAAWLRGLAAVDTAEAAVTAAAVDD